MNAETVFPDAECFRHHGVMPDWERLGQHVVARRTALGFRNRADFATAAQVSSRLLADIEKGRRSNFDPVTLAALEAVLGWETGSVQAVVDGGEPRVRPGTPALIAGLRPGPGRIVAGEVTEVDLIMESDLDPEQKLRAIRHVLLLRKQVKDRHEADADAQVRPSPSA